MATFSVANRPKVGRQTPEDFILSFSTKLPGLDEPTPDFIVLVPHSEETR